MEIISYRHDRQEHGRSAVVKLYGREVTAACGQHSIQDGLLIPLMKEIDEVRGIENKVQNALEACGALRGLADAIEHTANRIKELIAKQDEATHNSQHNQG